MTNPFSVSITTGDGVEETDTLLTYSTLKRPPLLLLLSLLPLLLLLSPLLPSLYCLTPSLSLGSGSVDDSPLAVA